jgi:2,5-diketo-D-gluconate reductase A
MSESRTGASESVELTTGTKMPILGLGTWQLRGSSALNATLRALDVGYRHIDTATAYGNEGQVGQAVVQSGVRREDIFVTTKLPPSRAGQERETLEASLDALALDYVDLWLIHWPPSGGARPDVWERFIEVQSEGLTREVGVSNYSVSQIDDLERATGRRPL